MNPAVGEIVEAWQQRWPALRLAHLYASNGEREAGLLAVVLALELGAARFALSDAQLATRKLGFWAEEFDAGAESRHPLSNAIGLRRCAANPAALFLADLEDALPEDVDAQLRRWKKIGAALAAATGGGSQEAAVYPLLWAAYGCLAVAEGLPLAQMPLSVLARGRPGPEVALPLSREYARALHEPWALLPENEFSGRRGQRVLALETLHGLGHAQPGQMADSLIARLARGLRCWRAASRLT